jgi:hypothetical protein
MDAQQLAKDLVGLKRLLIHKEAAKEEATLVYREQLKEILSVHQPDIKALQDRESELKSALVKELEAYYNPHGKTFEEILTSGPPPILENIQIRAKDIPFVVDFQAIPDEYKIFDFRKAQAAIAEGIEIPGVEVRPTLSVAVMTKEQTCTTN